MNFGRLCCPLTRLSSQAGSQAGSQAAARQQPGSSQAGRKAAGQPQGQPASCQGNYFYPLHLEPVNFYGGDAGVYDIVPAFVWAAVMCGRPAAELEGRGLGQIVDSQCALRSWAMPSTLRRWASTSRRIPS